MFTLFSIMRYLLHYIGIKGHKCYCKRSEQEQINDIGERIIMNLKGRNFLTLKDFTPEELTYLIDLSAELKAKK